MKKGIRMLFLGLTVFLVVEMLLPTRIQNPVEGCGQESYNQASFWHPWGGHNHRGIDIFAKKGTPVHPAIGGVVVATLITAVMEATASLCSVLDCVSTTMLT